MVHVSRAISTYGCDFTKRLKPLMMYPAPLRPVKLGGVPGSIAELTA
ncbi:MAG: hypothetical protein Q7J47_21355 [Azoarcus sp.]|nr:hypothetical protein [Azoarcus sp.]